MAEFVDVLRQFDRMCKANAGCFNCPLHEQDGVSDRCSIGAFVNDSERIEREVMKWAAEHPEPVYPTWGEWLAEKGELCKNWKDIRVISSAGSSASGVIGWFYKNIPADTAEKLGLQPKEG